MSEIGLEQKAEKAKKKPSHIGPDIKVNKYSFQTGAYKGIKGLNELPEDTIEKAITVGVDTGEKCRSGSFFQIDHSVVFAESYQKGIEVINITDAIRRYGWLKDYWWKAVKVDADKYTALAELRQNHGYFLRALPGVRVEFPLQACLYMSKEGLAQNVHNIIIAEEGSELHIITGCTTAQRVRTGLHVGISEFYVKRGAHVTFTMIHNWAEEMAVRPRTCAIVEKDGIFMSNYVCMRPVKTLQMYPTAYCTGENATVRYNTILSAPDGSDMDVGARVYLSSKGSRAEVITRAITHGGRIVARGHLIGEVPDIKAHLECRGLILSEKGFIHAIPELEGRVKGVDMSHEAAVGKIAEEEIQYLMSRRLSVDEATSAIIRGFLDVEIKGLPEYMGQEIKKATSIGKERLL